MRFRRRSEPSVPTLLLQSDEGASCIVIFEPWGMEYELRGEDWLRVTVSATEGGEIHVRHRSDSIVLWFEGSSTYLEVLNRLGKRPPGF